MAETNKGHKIVTVHGYTRKGPNGPVKVPAHRRSTPCRR